MVELAPHAALEDVGDAAKKLAVGEGSAIGAAAEMVALSLQQRPYADSLALADAVLAGLLEWPTPVSLIGGPDRRRDLRSAATGDDGATTWTLAARAVGRLSLR